MIFHSGVDSNIFGTYYHQHLAVRVSSEDLPLDDAELDALLKSGPQIERLLQIALQEVAWLHEVRHFHDCFGTLAGITLFDAHMHRLMAFAEVCAQLKRDNIPLRLPFLTWAKSADAPSYVKLFADRLDKGLFLEQIFLGSFELPTTSGHDTRCWSNFPTVRVRGEVPAFPLALASGYERDDGTLELLPGGSNRWVPLGFEVLLEGSAQALQRSILESRWPKEVSDLLWKLTTTSRGAKGGPIPEAPNLPYNIIDLLVSKYLRNEHDISQFPRIYITELIDRALMLSQAPIYGSTQTMLQPGGAFIMALELADWKKPAVKPLTPPTIKRKDLKALIDNISTTLSANAETTQSPAGIVRSMRDYALREITIPLLQARLRFGDKLFYDHTIYGKNITNLPLPPMFLTPSGVKIGDHSILQLWTKYVLFSDISQQIWSNSAILECGKATSTIPELAQFELAPVVGCTPHLKSRRCLHWYSGRESAMPDCIVTATLRAIGLDVI